MADHSIMESEMELFLRNFPKKEFLIIYSFLTGCIAADYAAGVFSSDQVFE